jgi:hypothetical protein
MREQVLRQFFQGKSSAAELAQDVDGSTKKVSVTSVEDMDEDFTVTNNMALRFATP